MITPSSKQMISFKDPMKSARSIARSLQVVVDEAVDESGLGNLTSRSATNAMVAIVERM